MGGVWRDGGRGGGKRYARVGKICGTCWCICGCDVGLILQMVVLVFAFCFFCSDSHSP